MESKALVELQDVLVQNWHITRVNVPQPGREEVLEALARRIVFLLKHDYDRLLTSLYVLDVPEAKFEAARVEGNDLKCAEVLAEAVLDRELEKLESRRKYQSESRNPPEIDIDP